MLQFIVNMKPYLVFINFSHDLSKHKLCTSLPLNPISLIAKKCPNIDFLNKIYHLSINFLCIRPITLFVLVTFLEHLESNPKLVSVVSKATFHWRTYLKVKYNSIRIIFKQIKKYIFGIVKAKDSIPM